MKILNLTFLILVLFFATQSFAMNEDDAPPGWVVVKEEDSSTFSKIDKFPLNKVAVTKFLGLGLRLRIEP